MTERLMGVPAETQTDARTTQAQLTAAEGGAGVYAACVSEHARQLHVGTLFLLSQRWCAQTPNMHRTGSTVCVLE